MQDLEAATPQIEDPKNTTPPPAHLPTNCVHTSPHGKSFSKMSVRETNQAFRQLKMKQGISKC